MQIRSISLSKLDKASMLTIMSNIIGILKEYDVEKLNLDFMLKILEKKPTSSEHHFNTKGPTEFDP